MMAIKEVFPMENSDKDRTITYSEIFHSIQGEGQLMGTPSVFFRTSGCNLRCWWCDTPYTSFHPENKKITVIDAANHINSFGCKHVVITGGEPFIQPEALVALCIELKKRNHHVTIETNGTRKIDGPIFADLVSISPKLMGSGPKDDQTSVKWQIKHENDRIAWDVLEHFINHTWCQFKFVISNRRQIDEIVLLQEKLPNLKDDLIWLMPEGATRSEMELKQEFVFHTCIDKGWNYSDRLQVRIHDNKRGV